MINFDLPPTHDNTAFTEDGERALLDESRFNPLDIGKFVGATLLRHTDSFNTIKIAAALECRANGIGARGSTFRSGVHIVVDNYRRQSRQTGVVR